MTRILRSFSDFIVRSARVERSSVMICHERTWEASTNFYPGLETWHNLCAICSVHAFFQAASAAAQAIARKMAKKQAPSAWATEEDETLDYCRML